MATERLAGSHPLPKATSLHWPGQPGRNELPICPRSPAPLPAGPKPGKPQSGKNCQKAHLSAAGHWPGRPPPSGKSHNATCRPNGFGGIVRRAKKAAAHCLGSSRDLMRVLHAKGRFDDHVEAYASCALGRFNLRAEHVNGIVVGRRSNLRSGQGARKPVPAHPQHRGTCSGCPIH